MHFLYDCRLHELGVARFGEEFAQFGQSQINDLLARFLDQSFRRTYDEFHIAALAVHCGTLILIRGHAYRAAVATDSALSIRSRPPEQFRFVKHPLDSAVQQYRVFEIADLAVEP